MSIGNLSIDDLMDAGLAGNRRALGRLLTMIENGGAPANDIANRSHRAQRGAPVIGITGAPGAGKSTLTGQLLRRLPALGLRPAVIAVDPSSPLTGGAILGDRVRMDDVAGDNGFIRSVATRGHAGGLALSVPGCARLFDAAGFDPVLIETVGVGQVEVDVAGAADTTVVVVNPGWGDAVQANKAGLLEVADVFVINKADRAGANDTRRDLDLMLDLSHVSGLHGEYRPPIVMTTATDGEGIDALWDAVEAHRNYLNHSGELNRRRKKRFRFEVASRMNDQLAEIVATLTDSTIADDDRSPAEVSRELLERMLNPAHERLR